MFIRSSILLVAVPAALAMAQTPPTPPSSPKAPITATPPMPAPVVSPAMPTFMPDVSGEIERAMSKVDRLQSFNDFQFDFAPEVRAQIDRASAEAALAKTRLDDIDFSGIDYKISENLRQLAPLPPALFDGSSYAKLATFGSGDDARPRAPWAQGDPADSIYRQARQAINNGDYRPAARGFNECYTKYATSRYAADCKYWEAFSKYRLGTTDELKSAEQLVEALSANPNGVSQPNDVLGLKIRIYSALAARGDAHAADELKKSATASGKPVCDRDDQTVRAEALSALSQMNSDEGLAATKRVLLEQRDECSADLRQNAAYIIGRRNDSTATPLLVQVAKTDPSKNVQQAALESLGRMNTDASIAALQDMLTSGDDDQQSYALSALGSSSNPRARQALRAILEKNPPASERLQMRAIQSMRTGSNLFYAGKDGGSNAVPNDNSAYLRSFYPKAKSDNIKESVIQTVSTSDEANSTFLMTIAQNANESSRIRGDAIRVLGRMNLGIPQLGKLYDDADSRNVREQIINSLEQRKEPEASDKLLEIAKMSTDPNLRNDAIRALTNKKDPRTQKLLEDLVRGNKPPGGGL